MALDKITLKNSIKSLQDELFANAGGLTSEQAATRFAEGLADAIDVFVRTGKPVVPGTGLTSPSGAVTGVSNTGSII